MQFWELAILFSLVSLSLTFVSFSFSFFFFFCSRQKGLVTNDITWRLRESRVTGFSFAHNAAFRLALISPAVSNYAAFRIQFLHLKREQIAAKG